MRRGWRPSLQTGSPLSYAVDPVGGFLFAYFIFLVSFAQEKILPGSSSCPGTSYVDQSGLDFPASVSQVLR